MPDEIFESAIRTAGDLAGVFEYDGDVGFFYLFDILNGAGKKVTGAIRVFSGGIDFGQEDVCVCWDRTESHVGLLIRGKLYAAFSADTGKKFGENFDPGAPAVIPSEVTELFYVSPLFTAWP